MNFRFLQTSDALYSSLQFKALAGGDPLRIAINDILPKNYILCCISVAEGIGGTSSATCT